MPLRHLGQRLKRNRAIRTANGVLVGASALTTASLALVVEDLFAKPDPGALFVGSRWGVLVFAVGVVVLAVRWRAMAQRSTGTLFYVQMLDEGMADQRLEALKVAAKKHLSRRSITRWLDLDGSTSQGVIDVHASCQEVGTALEELLNNDRDDTANTIAPNALWPMALALGMHLPADRPLQVTELPPPRREGEDRIAPAGRPLQDTEPSRESSDNDQEFSLQRDPSPSELFVTREELDDPTGERIGVWLAFTGMRKDFDVQWFRRFGVATAYTVTWDGVDPAVGVDRHYKDHELRRIAAGVAATLAELKCKHSNGELVVVAMIPKTVALAAGWHLAQHNGSVFRRTHLMNYDPRQRRYVPMRVRPSQPTTTPVVDVP